MNTVFVKPKWEDVVKIYLKIWDDLSKEGKEIAKEEIIRSAKLADKYVELNTK